MKKICILITAILLLSGCSSKQSDYTFMITRDNELYALYNQSGEKLTTYQYKTFKEVENAGYIVTNKDDQKGFISLEGDEVIPFGEYETLEATDQMLYATKKDNSQKTQTKQTHKANNNSFINDNLYVLNSEGKILYTASQDVQIMKSGLPIIHTKDEYIVLYKNGEELVKGKEAITLAKRYFESPCIVIGYENQSIVYDFMNDEDNPEKTTIKGQGLFQIVALDDLTNKSMVLYDQTQKKMVYIDRESHSMEEKNINVSKIKYDEKGNIVLEQGKKVFVYIPGKPIVEMNSYYLSGTQYLIRSQSVYGPHEVYKDGKKTGELKNCQLYPLPYLIQSNIFPVYIKDIGFKFYNFDRKCMINQAFLEAEPFDTNTRAIVRTNEKGYSLIDESGQIITKAYYSSIKYIGSSYYAVYNDKGLFGVIDAEGQEIFPTEYTYLPDQAITTYNERNYMILGKNGRSHVYEIDDDMNEIFSVEGEVVLDEKGYFIVGNEYYTFDGERME